MLRKSETETKLDAEIRTALAKLDGLEPTSEEYAKTVDMVSKLHKLKVEERPKRINPDTVLVVAANILGIVWITQHERFHPITTKSLGFVLKPTR